eukprot:jgi/Picre1/31663/NNA_007014.t1
MIAKLNALGVVFEYQLMGKYPPALYTCYGRPRRLSDEEVASVIEIQNPLYDVQLAEKYPGLFQDKYPQNPKMIRILGAKKEAAEAMQRDMDEQNRRDHQRENIPYTSNPLDFEQANFVNDNIECESDDRVEEAMGNAEKDLPDGLAFMRDLQPYLATFSREVADSLIKLLIKHNIPTGEYLVSMITILLYQATDTRRTAMFEITADGATCILHGWHWSHTSLLDTWKTKQM